MTLRYYHLLSCMTQPVVRKALLLTLLFLTTACSYHPPAPIEEYSSSIVKRQLNADGSYYVRKGDTLYAIAFGYGLDPKEVAKWNGIPSPYTIYPGQKLQLTSSTSSRTSTDPGSVQITAIESPGQSSTRVVTTPAPVEKKQTAPANTAPAKTAAKTTANTPPKSETKKTTTSTPPTTTKTTSSGTLSWKWPTKGSVRRAYVAGDPARNGLDIAGKEGQSIIAASSGQVVYSGNGLIGYGELIIIKHNEKILSAYAHNKVRLAHEGEKVTAGQKIAEMGRNASDEQILHFEIRVHGKPVNPLNYLPKK